MASDKKDRLKGVAGAGILGILGYAATKSNLIEDAISNAERINGLTIGRSAGVNNELREAGEAIKTDVNALKEATDRLRRESIDRLKDNFLNKVEGFLEDGEVKTSGERRAFLAAIFDSLREEELGTSAGQEIEDLIKNAYNAVPDASDTNAFNPRQAGPSLTQKDRQVLVDFFQNTFGSNEDALERFGKSYQKYYSSIEHFSPNVRTGNFGTIKDQKEAGRLNTLDEFFNKGGSKLTNTNQTIIKQRVDRLKKKLGPGIDSIAFRSFDEGGGDGVRSLYARVEFKGNKVLNIPLHLGRDETGNIIYRATENLSSRYVAPLHVIQANAILDTTSMSSTKFKSLGEAKGTGVVSFTNYIFDDILDNLRTGDIFNMSQRRINEITAYQRNFGLDASRTMMRDSLNNRQLISNNLYSNLHASRNFQASNALVVGLEMFDRGDQKNVVKRLLQFYGDELVGVNASQTMTARYDNPYDPSGVTKLFGQIGFRTAGNLTTLDAVQTLGIKDRVLLPQTGREGQLFGRYEAIEDLKGISTFGRTGLSAVTTAETGGLIGVSRNAKSTVGMNLAGFFVKERGAAKLGLAEGVSYFGGRVVTSTSMPKTVVESGLANTKLMDMLLARQASGEGGIRVAERMGAGVDFTIDDFFKQYGDDKGRAIIGHLDSDFAAIKRRGGLESFTLGLNEFTSESGRRRFHLIGQMNNVNMNSKLFSYLVKDTTSLVDEDTIMRKLINVAGQDAAEGLSNIYYQGMGGRIENTLLAGSGQLKKSVYNTTTSMFGALSMMDKYGDTGVSQDFFDTQMKSRLSGNKYLNRIKTIYNKSYTSIADASYTERTGAYLYESIDLALKEGFEKSVDKRTMGHILGSVEEFHGRFGFENNEKAILDLFETHGIDTSYTGTGEDKVYRSAFMQAYKSNVILAAGYATTGGVHAELGRNLARVEPRFMNYLYTNLRTNFGLSSGDATQYLSSIMLRQSGAESKATATLGMHLSMLSLSSLPGEEFTKELKTLGNIRTMSQEDLNDLKMFGQGKERQLSEFLARREKGQILDFADLIQDNSKLEQVKKRLGGRTQIFLPGAETLENFEGFKIRGSGKTIQIEGEYTRYLTDLISSINALGSEQNDELFNNALKSFQTSKNYLATVVGTAIRQSMSGDILGSGSYMGAGFRFGLTPDAGFEFSKDLAKRDEMRTGLFNAFNRQKGYVVFADAQAFLDGMTTYKEALKKELQVRNPNASKEEIHNMTRGLTGQRLREFFFSMYDKDIDAPTGLAQRNPTISFQHNLPGINIMRYDFAEGNQDAMFKYFREYRGTHWDEKGAKLYREKKFSAIRRNQAGVLGLDAFDDQKYLNFLSQHRAAKSRIDVLKTELYGSPIVDNSGKRVMEEVTIRDAGGVPRAIKRAARDETTVLADIRQGQQRVVDFHEARVATKEQMEAIKREGTLSDLQKRTSAIKAEDDAFNVRTQTPIVETSYESASERTSRTNIRALENKINLAMGRARASNKGISAADMERLLIPKLKDMIKRYKEQRSTIQQNVNLTKEEKSKQLEANQKKLKELYRNERFVEQSIVAKKQVEAGKVKPFYIDEEGRVQFQKIETARYRDKRGSTIVKKQGPGTYLGEFSWDFDNDKLQVKPFNFWGEEKVDAKAAYQELLTESGYADSSELGELRKAREFNIVQKASQLHFMENELRQVEANIGSNKKEFDRTQKMLNRLLAGETTAQELEEGIKLEAEMEEMQKQQAALEGRKKELNKRIPTLDKSLTSLIEAEGNSKLNINRVIASETLFNYYESKAFEGGEFNPEFMKKVGAFYGHYDSNEGSRQDFLTKNRTTAKKNFNKFVNTQIGPDKDYRSLTHAMRSMLGFEEYEYHQVERRVWDKKTKAYKTITSNYVASEMETERLANEMQDLEDLQNKRADMFEGDAKAAVEKDNAYTQKVGELKTEQAALTQMEKENEANLRMRAFEKQQMSLDAAGRVQLSDLEDQEIRESLKAHRHDFEDLSDAEQKKLIDDKKVINRLTNLERGLGVEEGDIDSYEKLRAATRGREADTISYEKWDYGLDKRVTVTARVDEEMDKMLLGLASHHEKRGGHGGGLLRFPEINIEATLSNAESGVSATYGGRMDLSRFMIGDFDADIYQIFHDTNKIARTKFNQNSAAFHGFYQAGGEYLFNMNILKEGMASFSKRIGSAGMNAEQFLLDQYSKEKILKDVGPIDVQVKAGMFAMVHNASQAALKESGDFGEYMRHTRAAAALVSVAQEVLVIKSKHLPVASNIADNFLKGMQSAFSTGNANQLIDFFETNVFKGGVFEGSGSVTVSDVRFKDLPDGAAKNLIESALESINMGKQNFNQTLHEMAKTGHDLNILGMMSDKRAQEIVKGSQLTTTRQLRQLLAASMEGGLIGTDKTFDYDILERGLRAIRPESAFNMSGKARGVAGLALGALGASYLVGSSVSTNKLDIEEKFSDMRNRKIESSQPRIGNRDHNVQGEGITGMGQNESFYQRPINIGESYVTNNYAAKMYGEAPSYSQAQSAARQFTSAGGQAFVSVQDNRKPISNSYITKSLRD